ncbi:hypothetical protein PMAYCL1PPCAC_05834, partial [Pristionchus mayeri]
KEVNYRNAQKIVVVKPGNSAKKLITCRNSNTQDRLSSGQSGQISPVKATPLSNISQQPSSSAAYAPWLSTKCSQPACDYRSMKKESLHKHEQSHSCSKISRRVADIKIDAKCPYCSLFVPNASTFVDHMQQCHSNLIITTSNVLTCNGYGRGKNGICPFVCSQTNEMLAHWEANAAAHGLPFMAFDYELAKTGASEKRCARAGNCQVKSKVPGKPGIVEHSMQMEVKPRQI